MMTNLFSTFDPATGIFSLNWISMLLPLIIMPMKFWNQTNKLFMIKDNIQKKLHYEMKMTMKNKGSSLIMMTMFMFILISNLMGLLPYVYTSTSQISFTLTLAFPMWLSLMIYGWTKKTNSMFSHLIPAGTPSILMPFMVMIESTSNLIRPGSLMVRLSANMIAGHLIMSLLGSNTSMIHMLIIIMMLIMMFEMAVSMIQAYVFMTLVNLYSSEI